MLIDINLFPKFHFVFLNIIYVNEDKRRRRRRRRKKEEEEG